MENDSSWRSAFRRGISVVLLDFSRLLRPLLFALVKVTTWGKLRIHC